LAVALALAAVLGAGPAVLDVAETLQLEQPNGVSPWACGLLLLCVVQLAYAFYLVQLPDWSTAWVVTLATLAVAALYAMLLAIVSLSSADGRLIQLLRLSDRFQGGAAAGWCFVMLCITALLSYFLGRFAVRWRRSYELVSVALRPNQES
jgi:hypothetical protein